jgi:hypothetical protein
VPDPTRLVARARVPLGYAFAIAVVIIARPTGSSLLWGSLIAVPGEALRVWSAGHLNKSREVTSSGPYRWLAHPLYVGSAVMALGLAVASNSAAVAVLIALYIVVTLTAAIRSEEAFLRGRFGADYDRYKSGRDTGAHNHRFSLSLAVANGEYRAAVGLAGAVLLLVVKALYDGTFWPTAGTP